MWFSKVYMRCPEAIWHARWSVCSLEMPDSSATNPGTRCGTFCSAGTKLLKSDCETLAAQAHRKSKKSTPDHLLARYSNQKHGVWLRRKLQAYNILRRSGA